MSFKAFAAIWVAKASCGRGKTLPMIRGLMMATVKECFCEKDVHNPLQILRHERPHCKPGIRNSATRPEAQAGRGSQVPPASESDHGGRRVCR